MVCSPCSSRHADHSLVARQVGHGAVLRDAMGRLDVRLPPPLVEATWWKTTCMDTIGKFEPETSYNHHVSRGGTIQKEIGHEQFHSYQVVLPGRSSR